MSSINQLRAFRTIQRHGTFAAAAKVLGITQSTISMQIAAMEEFMGVVLFDRQHRPPKLTKAGAEMLKYAHAIVEQYDEMAETISRPRGFHGEVRIGVIATSLTNLLPAALVHLRQQHPKLIINVVSGMSDALMDMLSREEIDMALIHRPDQTPDGFKWHSVARQEIVVIAPPGSTETNLHEVFKKYPYIRFNRHAKVASPIETRLETLGISPRVQAEIESAEAIISLIRLGFGVSVLPKIGGVGKSVQLLAFGKPSISRTIGILSHGKLSRNGTAEIISDAFSEAMANTGA